MYCIEMRGYKTIGSLVLYRFTQTIDDLEYDDVLKIIRHTQENSDDGDWHFDDYEVFRLDAIEGWVCVTGEVEADLHV